MLAAVTPGKLIGRLLKEASAVRRNAETIKKALEDAGESGRRSELFGTILAGAWTLTHSGPVTPDYLEECRGIAASSRLALVEENDSERCLRTIIEYRDKNEGGLLLSELLLHGIPSGNENDQRSERQNREAAARNGVALKPEGGSPKTLFIACGHTAMKEIFKGTDWEGGNCKGALSNFEGVEFKKERLLSGTYRGVSIPLHLVFPDRFPPPEETKDPDDTQNNGDEPPEPEPSRDVVEQEGTPFDDETEFSNNGTERTSPVPETRPGHHGKPEEPPDRPPENDAGRHPPRNAVFQQPFFPGGKPPMNQPTNHKTEKTP